MLLITHNLSKPPYDPQYPTIKTVIIIENFYVAFDFKFRSYVIAVVMVELELFIIQLP